jgi:hypothetical protein
VVYPNPATGAGPVYVTSPSSTTTDVEVDLFTVSFRKVQGGSYANVTEGQALPIDLTDKTGVPLANGIYYIVLRADGHQWVTKLLVLR